MNDQYDYIIVGAGSAGCPLANRLSADPAITVLLVESGPEDSSPFVSMPRGIGVILNPGSKLIWEYEPKLGRDKGTERWFRGRVLGGSSSVNGMVYVRGAPRDYDGWAALGCTGWSWNEIGAKFVELEDHDQGPGKWRGTGGPLRITTHPSGDPLCEAILDAAAEMGAKRVADVNDVDVVRDGGMGYQPTTTWGGKRVSASKAFLAPVRNRPNLHVVTDTDVLKVEFDGKRASAVKLRDKSGVRSVRAKREIIISAGAFNTPKLLQLSGIGPADLLRSHGIPVIVDSPDVGRNLREHRHFDLNFKVRSNSQNRELGGARVLLSMLKYFIGSKGPMTHSAHEIGGFIKSEPGLDHADVQIGLCMVSAVKSEETGKIALSTFPGITILGYFTNPESQGEIRIQSSDPDVPADIDINHLDAEIDRKKGIAVLRWIRKLSTQPALKDWIVDEFGPASSVHTDEEIIAKAMQLGGTCFHSAGTARMGIDDRAVLDPQLRVRGVKGLRVADTSIMPTLVSGNTNAPAMVIGMRAADFILADRR